MGRAIGRYGTGASATATAAMATTLSEAAAAEPEAAVDDAEDVERGDNASSMSGAGHSGSVAPQSAQAELPADAEERRCESEAAVCADEASAGSVGGAATTATAIVPEEGERARPQHLCSPVGSHRPQASSG